MRWCSQWPFSFKWENRWDRFRLCRETFLFNINDQREKKNIPLISYFSRYFGRERANVVGVAIVSGRFAQIVKRGKNRRKKSSILRATRKIYEVHRECVKIPPCCVRGVWWFSVSKSVRCVIARLTSRKKDGQQLLQDRQCERQNLHDRQRRLIGVHETKVRCTIEWISWCNLVSSGCRSSGLNFHHRSRLHIAYPLHPIGVYWDDDLKERRKYLTKLEASFYF